MKFEFYILLLLLIIPSLYKYSFWLFTIQLKEYRIDRFKEYLSTQQWKKAIKNFWFFVEAPIFLFSIIYFLDSKFEVILANMLLYLLLLENIFVIWKTIRRKILKPKVTWRLILTLLSILMINVFLILFINTYLFIFINLLLVPIIIFLSIFFTLPIVNLKKRKLISSAIKKNWKYKKIIKVWITWSYWKSSVKEYLSQILSDNFKVLSSPENINTELGISSLIINKLKKKYDYFIAEMWAYKIWEIETLWNIVNHKHWFLTAIWNQHLALFWSIKNTIEWKKEIEKKVNENWWILYVNWDNENVRKAKFKKNTKLVKYWTRKKADAVSEVIWIKKWLTEFIFKYWKIETKFKTNLLWKHNIINITWIIAFCFDQWLTKYEIKKSLKKLQLPKNTLEFVEKKWNILINDTYNLSEWWLFAWLEIIKSYNKSLEKILVIDELLELWKKSWEIHQDIAKKIAKKKYVDKIIYVGENNRKDFIKWLVKWWFKVKDVITDLNNIWKDNIILFEWRKSKLLFNKILWKK